MIKALKYTKQLEDVGFTREQAEAHIQIMTEVIDTNLATKQDMKDFKEEVRQDMKDFKYQVRQDMKDFKDEVRQDIKNFRTEFENRLIQMEYRLVIKLGSIVAVSLAACVTIIKLL